MEINQFPQKPLQNAKHHTHIMMTTGTVRGKDSEKVSCQEAADTTA